MKLVGRLSAQRYCLAVLIQCQVFLELLDVSRLCQHNLFELGLNC